MIEIVIDIKAEFDLKAHPRVVKKRLFRGEAPLTYREVIELWCFEREFRTLFNTALGSVAFDAFFWETPPVSASRLEQSFEFVLVDAPALAGVKADAYTFRDQFRGAESNQDVKVFRNLGGDAHLITPCPRGEENIYPHLAAFVRNAPPDQCQHLWRRLGEVLATTLGDDPVWVSTSGLGVFWVHIRVDRSPKYYTFAPYRCLPETQE